MKSLLKIIRYNIEKNLSINDNVGILNGTASYILYNTYYENFIEQKKDNFTEVIINNCIEKINSRSSIFTFCDGIVGFAWTLSFLDRNEFNYVDNSIYKSLDILAMNFFNYSIDKNYDFLHGVSGCVYYFYYRFSQLNTRGAIFEPFFEKYIDHMEQNYINIKFSNNSTENRNFNAKIYSGLAHGIASYISILGKLSSIPQLQKRCSILSKNFYQLLIEYKFQYNTKISLFPTYISEISNNKQEDSMLSWCTGDLGIGLSLLNTGIKINDDIIKHEGFEILLHSTERIKQHQTRLNTPNLCHGYFGVYKIFSQAYNLTQEKKFLTAKNYWLNMGLNDIKKNLPNDLFLINGQTGIGLTLIDAYTETDHNWGECMLIS